MPIYINTNGQQRGPYEEDAVRDQLRSGSLSPDDMGIRQGDSAWQRLGDIFPEVASRSVSAAAPLAATVEPAKKGGCLKPAMLGIGALFLVLGLCVAIGGQFIPSSACDIATSDDEKIGKLRRDLDKARSNGDFSNIAPLTKQLESAMAGAETTRKYCNDDKFRNNAISITGGLMALVGFVVAVIGLFVGRKK